MKSFESFLADKLEEFISYRHDLGLKNRSLRSHLRYLDNHVIKKRASWDDLTPLFFLDFQNQIKGTGRTVNAIISAARGFFQFLIRRDHVAQNPLRDIPSRPENCFIPFIFSLEDVDLLLRVMQENIRKTERNFFRDYTVYMAVLLIARCGLRISEPLSLLLSSYRPEEQTIYIEKTKFYKDRLLPLPQSTAAEILNYIALRNHFGRENNPYLLPGVTKDRGMTTDYVYRDFHMAVKKAGLATSKRVIGNTTFGNPTPHSLRHSFAVNTLKSIKERGESPQKALPVLSAYMGHRKYSYTAVYLKVLDARQRGNLVDFNISHQEEL